MRSGKHRVPIERKRLIDRFGHAAAVLLLLFLFDGATSPSWSCGGFFCSNLPMNQTSERILFIAEDEQVSVHVQIQFAGTAEDFAWVLPVPSVPELSVSHNEIFRQLQFATQPTFILDWPEESECDFRVWPLGAEEDAVVVQRDVDVVSEDRVGPYQTAVIRSDDAQAILDWLTSNGYELGDLGAELLAPYVEDGFLFLALRLSADREIGDLQPIAMTYAGTEPMIPIRLTAVATEPDLGVLAWVLGPARAVPTNYLHVRINEALIDWFNGGFNYTDVVTQAANEAGGQSFVTDYAGSPAIMDERLFWEDRYDLESLRQAKDPQGFVDQLLRQGFPRADSQMQALLRRHIPMPQIILEEGVLEIVFRGDVDAYREAEEDGTLQAIAEQSFYNNMESYRQYNGDIEFDAGAFVVSLDEVVVTPLRKGQQLFSDFDYLTRLFTTLSADEMTLDPVFAFNPDLDGVDNVRRATARFECPNFNPDDPRLEDIVLVVTLADGREIRSNPFVQPDPEDQRPFSQPAAAVIERMDVSGQPQNLSRITAVEETTDPQPVPAEFELLPNRPNPFNGATVIPLVVSVSTRDASLTIYNLAGQSVRTLFQERTLAGYSEVVWDGTSDAGSEVSTGVYVARLETGDRISSRKILFLQ